MKILFTCAGRRNYLLGYFKDVIGSAGSVLAADMDISAPAMQQADRRFIVPSVDSDDYIDKLLEICKSESVDLLVPLNDLELPMLSGRRSEFSDSGTCVLVSNQAVIRTCFDKLETNEFLSRHGFRIAQTFTDLNAAEVALAESSLQFPLIIKPRWGSASIQIYTVYSLEELRCAFFMATAQLGRTILASVGDDDERQILIQERLPGSEYGIDVLNDLNGRFRCVFTKSKKGMRAGETEKAMLVDNPSLSAIGQRLGELLGHIGNLDCDVFVDGDDIAVLELNPRFGGGYPFSQMFGANYPAAIVAWVQSGDFDTSSFIRQYHCVATKYDRLISAQID